MIKHARPAILALGALLPLTGIAACGGSGGATPSATPAAARTTQAAAAPSLTAAQQQFTSDMASKYGLGDGTSSSNTAVVATGDDICTMLKAGSAEADIASVTRQARSSLSAADAAGIVKLAGQDLCPADVPKPFQAETLLNVSGSGQYTTVKFTIGGNGDYDVDWTYGEGSMGSSVNFDFTADGGGDSQLTGPNQLGTGGSGVTHVYSDAGTHYLQVSSEGNWTVKVVTAP